jgi:hypothetical protein
MSGWNGRVCGCMSNEADMQYGMEGMGHMWLRINRR